ncbi:MAG TPA: hypothetical protein VGI95_18645 [Caulobacteraceae bacterium]|jgi:hypothetical protein
MPTAELLTAAPVDALTPAHIQAMRAMSDHMALLSANVAALSADVKTARDGVLRLEAQDLKASIAATRAEALAAVKELRADHAEKIEQVAGLTQANRQAISRTQGMFVPLAALGGGVLAFVGELAANLFGGHHP